MARENSTQGISFSPELLKKVKVRAEKLGLSVSAYIQQLVKADLEQPSAVLNSATLAQIAGHLAELVDIRKNYIQFPDSLRAVADPGVPPVGISNPTLPANQPARAQDGQAG